jgi:hypothetical protein
VGRSMLRPYKGTRHSVVAPSVRHERFHLLIISVALPLFFRKCCI